MKKEKVKAQDLQFGDYVDEIGLIKSTSVREGKVRLEALPMHLEYYGLENSGALSLDDEYNIYDTKDTIMYIFHCVVSLSRAKKDCKNAEYKFIQWLREHKTNKHAIIEDNKKLKHVKKNEVVEDYGLILKNGKSKLFGKKEIKLIGKSFKIFSSSTMFAIGGGLNDTVAIINNDEEKINKFIADMKQELIDTEI